METERLYALLANIPDVVWTTDSEGNTTFISPNVEQVYGFTPDEILQAGSELWLDRIHPDDVQRVQEAYESLLARGEAFDVEYRIRHRDGHWIWLHDKATVSYDRDGTRYADGVFSDITERVKAESQRDAAREALHKERDLIAAVLDTAGALVVVLDPQGRIERFNRACERLTGYSFDQVRGKYLWDFLLPEEVEAVRAVFEELQAGQFPNEHENHWVGKDGSRRLIAWSNTVLLDDGGAVEYVIGTGIDVEEERRREREARVLAEIAKLASGTLHLDEVLERTAEYARDLFQADHCGIALYDEARDTLRYVVVKGDLPELAADPRESEIRPTEVFRERVLGALQPMVVEDAVSDPSVGPQLIEFVRLLEIQSFVVAPMEVGERPLGFMALTIRRGRQQCFRAEDAELALAMANQAAMAIDNARLYEAQQRRAEQFRLISEVGRRITSILDVDDLLKEITCLVKEALGYYLVGIALIEGDELVFKEGAGGAWEVPEFQPPRLPVGQKGITGWVAQHGEPLLVPDVSEEPRYYALPQASEVRSELAVPLKAQDAIVGVLHAQSDRLVAFDESDLDVLQSLAHQAAIAIENARSYASARQELAARKKAEAALQRMNEELEQRVAQRTTELTKANASLRAEVAERARAEKALRESEMRYRTLFQSANDAIFVMRGDRFLECNQATEAMFGCSCDDIVGSFPYQFSPPRQPDGSDSRGKALEKIDAALDGTPQFFEWLHCRMDGTLFDAEVSLNRMSLGGEWLLLAMVRDVTKRKRAEEALRRYADRLQILHEIDQSILAAQSPEDIAQAAVSYVRQLVPCQRAGITLFDLTADEAIVLAVDTDAETGLKKGARVPLDPFEDVVRAGQRGQVVTWGDLRSRGRAGEIVNAEGIHSYASVPLVAGGELIGALNLGMVDPDALTPEHIDIARQVADQVSIAIQQARLHAQVQRHAQELEQRVSDRTRELLAMYEVMAIASQSLDLETTLDRTLERVLEAVDSDIGAIYLLDDEEETLHLSVERGVPTEFIDLIRTMPSSKEGLGGWVIQHGEPLLVHDISSDPRLDARLRTAPLQYVGVPMRAGGRTRGVLGVLREATRPQFGGEEVNLLASLADRVGAVVESSQLRARAEQAAVLEERHRLARELHDSVTQSLYSATLMAETGQLATAAGDLDVAGSCLARLGDVTQQALKEMRLLIYELRPPELEREGLVGALQQRLDAVEARAGTEARLLTEGEIELDASQEDELYRIALEALNNVLKHASATAVTVRVSAKGQSVYLEVADNGQGFDPQAVADKGGMGLITMRERAERVGGRLTIQSVPGEGTEVRVEVRGSSGNA